MLKIELVPTLSQCIETTANKKYDEIVGQLLTPGAHSQELLAIAELIKSFLETADFKKLRAESERYLIEGKQAKFTVYEQGGVTKCEMRAT